MPFQFVSRTIQIALVLFLLTFTACQCDRRLNVMEQADANRAELEKVLHHYKDDEQKLQAVRFLFANMDVHNTTESPTICCFRQGMDSLYRHHPNQNEAFCRRAYDVLLRDYHRNEEEPTRRYDAESLMADYLIAHIDSAFQAWKAPWNSNYSFELTLY